MGQLQRTALILAGHGSHISPHTAGIVWGYVDRLRAMGVADEITACFWKEQPSFHDVLNTVTAEQVVIVPVFTAQGYFTQSVIPTEMGLDGEITQRDGKTIHYAKTLGEHPDLARIIRQRVDDTLLLYDLDPQQTSVAILGHGTKRNSQSQDATREQVRLLAAGNRVRDVLDGYLDDDPTIPSIYSRAQTDNIIAIPFFLAPGSHVSIDVPEALELPEGESTAFIEGKRLYYTDPVGTDDAVCELIVDLARDAGLLEKTIETSVWDGFPQSGWNSFIDYLKINLKTPSGIAWFGQLLIFVNQNQVVPMSMPDYHTTEMHTPAELRQYVRENPFYPVPDSLQEGSFRSLSSRLDLPRTWFVRGKTPEDVCAIIETVYPGVIADWAAAQDGTIEYTAPQEVFERQHGAFKKLIAMSESQIEHTIDSVCGRCIKHPGWFPDANQSQGTMIPCREPCNFWMSQATEGVEAV